MVYISIPAVTAYIGFALTASHLEERQVTKRSCPFRPVPRSGPAPWAHCAEPALGLPRGQENQKQIKSQSEAA